MGLLLNEVVVALHPEHRGVGHHVNIRHKGSQVLPEATWWTCACGVSGTISSEDIRKVLNEGLVTRT